MPVELSAASEAKSGLVDRFARKLVMALLERLQSGRLIVEESESRRTFIGHVDAKLSATVCVHDPRAYRSLAFGGTTAAGESYMRGEWSADNLTALVRLFIRNAAMMQSADSGWGRLREPIDRAYQFLRRNTRAGSRKNISAHYDLGNDFFALFLDESMMYSSGLYEREEMTLGEAQTAKLDRLCRKLELKASDHLLEIGTGWGGLAMHAAKHYGCRVTTTTLSREQRAFAMERIEQAGLSDRIEVLLEDYRDLSGEYDKLVSIEMIEAVGHEYFETYFAACSRLLKPTGLMAIQAITIGDQHYEAYRRGTDFIRRYIFPGGALPSIEVLTRCIKRATDMRVIELRDFAEQYAHTLREWRARFKANESQIAELGYPEDFRRMWEFYLCSCEVAFEERHTGLVQMVIAKPNYR